MSRRTTVRLAALVALAAIAAAGCGQNEATLPPAAATAWPNVVLDGLEMPVIAPGSAYVEALCSIDFIGEPDDPDLGGVIAQLRDLPTSTDVEAAEAAWLAERLELVNGLEDPLSTEDISAVGAVLRARCSL